MATDVNKSFYTNERNCVEILGVMLHAQFASLFWWTAFVDAVTTPGPAQWSSLFARIGQNTKIPWRKAQSLLYPVIPAFMTQRHYCYCDQNSKLGLRSLVLMISEMAQQ